MRYPFFALCYYLQLKPKRSVARACYCCVFNAGFMCGTTVLDKDGVSAAAVVAEMVAYLASQGKTVLQHLSYLHDTLDSFLFPLQLMY